MSEKVGTDRLTDEGTLDGQKIQSVLSQLPVPMTTYSTLN